MERPTCDTRIVVRLSDVVYGPLVSEWRCNCHDCNRIVVLLLTQETVSTIITTHSSVPMIMTTIPRTPTVPIDARGDGGTLSVTW